MDPSEETKESSKTPLAARIGALGLAVGALGLLVARGTGGCSAESESSKTTVSPERPVVAPPGATSKVTPPSTRNDPPPATTKAPAPAATHAPAQPPPPPAKKKSAPEPEFFPGTKAAPFRPRKKTPNMQQQPVGK